MDEGADKLFQGDTGRLQAKKGNIPQNQRSHNLIDKGTALDRTAGKTSSEYWEEAKRIYRERAERGRPELATGIKWIDEWTDGLHKGEVWCVSGRPGAGKTSLAVNIARNIADTNKSVLFISLEMTGEQLISRIFCEMMDYDHSRLRVGDFEGDFLSKDKLFTDFINKVDFEIIEKGYRFQDILNVLNGQYEVKPDLIVLDFVQLIDKEGLEDRLALDEFMRKIAELAKTEKLAILIVSQLRRLPSGADMNRVPDIADNRGSSMIEQLATTVVIIYKKIEKILNVETEKIFIKIAKNRHGSTGEREMLFKGNIFKFEEITYEDNLYAQD